MEALPIISGAEQQENREQPGGAESVIVVPVLLGGVLLQSNKCCSFPMKCYGHIEIFEIGNWMKLFYFWF